MKKILACVVALFPIALFAVSSGGDHPVYINGKPFSRAVLINGTLAVPLEDISKAAGSPVSLEPAFQLRGNTLNATMGWDVKKNVKTVAKQSQQKVDISDINISKTYDKSSPLMFKVNRPGAVTNNVLMFNGKAYVPLSDLARAFGGVWMQPAGLAPGAAIQLNFTSNPNAILIGL
ncbi:MAG TPA: hypothetical protein VL284_01590 [Thermoanaerobaculia bacterium]|nr:hypothetical protein [Thermoanaerobaculia bacterium]